MSKVVTYGDERDVQINYYWNLMEISSNISNIEDSVGLSDSIKKIKEAINELSGIGKVIFDGK
jgi:hypothetical protein